MARRGPGNDDPSLALKSKHKPNLDSKSERDKKTSESESESKQERSELQDLLGNTALSDVIFGQGTKAGEAGQETERAGPGLDQQVEGEGVNYGGMPDPPPTQGPLTFRNYRRPRPLPKHSKKEDEDEDAPVFEPEDLPPEDPEFMKALATAPLGAAHPAFASFDQLLQPSRAVLATRLDPWFDAVIRWRDTSLHHRVWAWVLKKRPSCIEDNRGRSLLGRIRVTNLALWMLLDRFHEPSSSKRNLATFVTLNTELSGRAQHHILFDAKRASRVTATEVLTEWAPNTKGSVHPCKLDPNPHQTLSQTFSNILQLPIPSLLVPILKEPTPKLREADEDPLNLDNILNAFTVAADEGSIPYDTAIQQLERLSTTANEMAVRVGGASASLLQLSKFWQLGSPKDNIEKFCFELDSELARMHDEIADLRQVCTERSQPLAYVTTKMSGIAKQIEGMGTVTVEAFTCITAAMCPGIPEPFPTLASSLEEPLDMAMANDRIQDVLSILRSKKPSLSRDAAIVFARMVAGEPSDDLIESFMAIHEMAVTEENIPLASVMATCAGPCILQSGNATEAMRIAQANLKLGFARHHGLMILEAGLLAMEALIVTGQASRAKTLQLELGQSLWEMGATGSVSLLSRWEPPPSEDED